jgi:hypothetical protein
MKLGLRLADRFALHSVLPTEGHVLEIKAVRSLREELMPDQEEQRAVGMVINDRGQPQWPAEKEGTPRGFTISETVFDIVRRELKALDGKGKIRDGHLKIYEVFVDNDFQKDKKDK